MCRCVKSSYVVYNSGVFELIWKDQGSGASRDVALYANTNIGSANGIDTITFTSFTTYKYPNERPVLLNSKAAKLKSLISTQSNQVALIVYQVTETERIWKDSGSGADVDFSSYRAIEPDSYYSLGDIGVASHSKPAFSIMVREVKSGVLEEPKFYRLRWNDRGTGADEDVSFHEPTCPPGYNALGYVTINTQSTPPSKRDIRCVNSTYTMKGKWKYVWNDAGSGADTDVTVWEAVPSGSGQGVRAMSARPCHCKMDRTAYVLNPAFVQYIVSKPVKRYYLNEISYDINSRDIVDIEPEILARTMLINTGDTPQQASREITFSYEEKYSWTTTVGLEVGVSITVSAGVPKLISSEVRMQLYT